MKEGKRLGGIQYNYKGLIQPRKTGSLCLLTISLGGGVEYESAGERL